MMHLSTRILIGIAFVEIASVGIEYSTPIMHLSTRILIGIAFVEIASVGIEYSTPIQSSLIEFNFFTQLTRKQWSKQT